MKIKIGPCKLLKRKMLSLPGDLCRPGLKRRLSPGHLPPGAILFKNGDKKTKDGGVTPHDPHSLYHGFNIEKILLFLDFPRVFLVIVADGLRYQERLWMNCTYRTKG